MANRTSSGLLLPILVMVGLVAVFGVNRRSSNVLRSGLFRTSKACPRSFQKTYPKSSCDEYPFASTEEGGAGARTEEVHKDEQDCQGGTLSTSCRYQNVKDGERFLVVTRHPDKVGTRPWQGEEIKVGGQRQSSIDATGGPTRTMTWRGPSPRSKGSARPT